MQSLDKELAGLLSVLLEPFTHYASSLSAFAILVLLAVVITIRMRRVQRKILEEIADGTGQIARYEDPEAFSAAFGVINASLGANHSLGRSWQEYEETLIPPLEEIDDPAYRVFRNTKRPTEFFFSEQYSDRLSPWMRPEDFIGIGLLLTFIGLVAALVEAGDGLGSASNDAAELKGVILTLLSTAGAKFIASIGGVFGSLIVSITQRKLFSSVDRDLNVFSDLLEERLIFASAEKIAADQFGHMKRQTVNLERLSNEIAVAIGDKIEAAMNRMPAMMGEAMQPVTAKLEDVAGQIGQSSADGMAGIVSQLSDELKGAGQESMQQVVTQLDSLTGAMGGAVDSLRLTTENLKESLTGSAKQAASDLSGSSELFSQRITEAVESMNQSQQGLHDSIMGMVNQLEGGSKVFSDSMNDVQAQAQDQLLTVLKAMNSQIADQASESSKAWQGEIENTIAAGAARTAKTLRTTADQMSAQFKAPMEAMQSELGGLAIHAKEVSSALAAINSELGAHKEGIATSTSRLIEASGAMQSASDAARLTAMPMRDAAVATKTATEQLLAISQTTTDQVARFSERIGESIKETGDVLRSLQSIWQAQSGQLENADEELARAFKAITSNLTASLAQLEEFNKNMDSSMARAVEGLSAMVEELSDAVDSIPR